jgi:hypothetical protein
MTTPSVDPQAADAAVQAQLAEQAATVTGNPAAAGVYGDPAGASAPPAPLDLSRAAPTVVDVEALAKQFAELQAKVQAAEDAANPPPAEPDNSLHADSNAPGWLHDLVSRVEARLHALEVKAGLAEDDTEAE